MKHTLPLITATQLNPKNPRSTEEKSRNPKGIENTDLGEKHQAWRHWKNHFESTKKVTQLTEQVSVM